MQKQITLENLKDFLKLVAELHNMSEQFGLPENVQYMLAGATVETAKYVNSKSYKAPVANLKVDVRKFLTATNEA